MKFLQSIKHAKWLVIAGVAGVALMGALAFGLNVSARGNGPSGRGGQTSSGQSSQMQPALGGRGAHNGGDITGTTTITSDMGLPFDAPPSDAQGPGGFGGPGRPMSGTITGTVPGGPGRGGLGPMFGLSSTSPISIAAAQLGVDVSALNTQLQSGKTISDVAAAQGVSLSTISDAILAAMKSDLARAVSDGKLTQTQADQILVNAPAMINAFLTGQRPARPPHAQRGPHPGSPMESPLPTPAPSP